MDKWSPLWELTKYWDAVMSNPELVDTYKREFEKDLLNLNMDAYDLKHGVIADVGGGAFGGVFGFRDIGSRKILVDPLGAEFFLRYGCIPNNVEILDGVSQNLPLEDASLDAMFSVETLDHCNDVNDFTNSIKEMGRVIKPKGLLFFMMPYRPKSIEGHFISQMTLPYFTLREWLTHSFDFDFFKSNVDGWHIFAVGRRKA